MRAATGKIILFGEHAVVYGHPAIAVPLSSVQATATAEFMPPGSGLTICALDLDRTLNLAAKEDDPLYNALVYPALLTLQTLNLPAPDLKLTVRSTIPVASGLGSGAAIATALVRALAEALEHPLPNDELNALIYEVEKRHHGTPSGIDNTVIVYQQPVYFVRGQHLETFSIARPFTLLVADTGIGYPTHLAVGDVRKLYEAEPERIGAIFDRIGEITRAARQAIESGRVDDLGPLMNENHVLLRDLTVSSPELDHLCDVARTAGAAGAKLSGGGRGGNLIALVDEFQAANIAGALRAAGAARVIQTCVESPG